MKFVIFRVIAPLCPSLMLATMVFSNSGSPVKMYQLYFTLTAKCFVSDQFFHKIMYLIKYQKREFSYMQAEVHCVFHFNNVIYFILKKNISRRTALTTCQIFSNFCSKSFSFFIIWQFHSKITYQDVFIPFLFFFLAATFLNEKAHCFENYIMNYAQLLLLQIAWIHIQLSLQFDFQNASHTFRNKVL